VRSGESGTQLNPFDQRGDAGVDAESVAAQLLAVYGDSAYGAGKLRIRRSTVTLPASRLFPDNL
jgi:hypothetical protein